MASKSGKTGFPQSGGFLWYPGRNVPAPSGMLDMT